MPTPRCPRCQGLLVPTVHEDKPIRCVNCAGRFDREDVMPHTAMTPGRKRRASRPLKSPGMISQAT